MWLFGGGLVVLWTVAWQSVTGHNLHCYEQPDHGFPLMAHKDERVTVLCEPGSLRQLCQQEFYSLLVCRLHGEISFRSLPSR